MVLPLNDRGANFITEIMRRTTAGLSAKQANVPGSVPAIAHTINSYQIDRSTTFSGNITVQANDPNELITKLRSRQRVMALSQAAMGGRRT